MPAPFTRTMRSLAAESSPGLLLVLAPAALLLGAWSIWFFGAEVAVLEVADVARIEVDQIASRVDAPVTGRVEAVHLTLGKEVEAGEILVELESTSFQLELREKHDRVKSIAAELEQAKKQRETVEEALRAHSTATLARIEEAKARHQEASEQAKLAKADADRSKRLFEGGFTSASEQERSSTEESVKSAVVAASQLGVGRVTAEGKATESDLAGSLAQLGRELAQLEGSKSLEEAAIARLEYEVERRKIRAPVAGRLGDVAIIQPYVLLEEGEQIAVIVPKGDYRLVATFPAATAVGRVRPGQHGRLRLAGFPWAQYGMLKVVVAGVASEAHEGKLRVELTIERDPASQIPIQHGLAGTVEVEVERVSPAELVLRFAGRLLRGEQRS